MRQACHETRLIDGIDAGRAKFSETRTERRRNREG